MIRHLRAVTGVVLFGLGIGASIAVAARPASNSLAPLVWLDTAFNQQVSGDFDGDARTDRLEIDGDARIAMHLSRSPVTTQLLLASTSGAFNRIVGLIGIDVDRDGDLDLVASLSGGGFAVWINGGNGHFEQARPRAPASTALTSALLFGSLPITPNGVMARGAAHPSRPLTIAESPRPLDTMARLDAPAIRLNLDRTNPGRAPPPLL